MTVKRVFPIYIPRSSRMQGLNIVTIIGAQAHIIIIIKEDALFWNKRFNVYRFSQIAEGA